MAKEVSIKEVKKLWEGNTKPIQLYVHSAFCPQKCNYCVFYGAPYEKKEFKSYFYSELPKEIKSLLPVIEKQPVRSVYFGGGTPNFYEDLRNLQPSFDLLRHVKCDEKVIELHTSLPITDKTVAVLKKENFTTVILGIQTFDEKKLKAENRIVNQANNIEKIIEKLKNAGMNVGVDLLAFPDSQSRILSDIDTLCGFKVKPDEVTVAMLYRNREYSWIGQGINKFSSNGFVLTDSLNNATELFATGGLRFVLRERLKDFKKTLYTITDYLEYRPIYNRPWPMMAFGYTKTGARRIESRSESFSYQYSQGSGKVFLNLIPSPIGDYRHKIINFFSATPIADHVADGTQFLITVKNTGGGNDDIFVELLGPVDMKKYDASNAYEFK